MTDAQIAFGIEQLKLLKVLDGGDAATMGIGIITEARWRATYDYMVAAGLLKPEVDWKAGFTDRFVKSLKLFM
jgi:NitT/TauT family transport system substrate-binding protein